jgi:hypothetical protein
MLQNYAVFIYSHYMLITMVILYYITGQGQVALDKSSLLLKNILQNTDITTIYNH